MNISNSKYKTLTEAERRLKNLSPKRLLVANDILAYLEDRESSDATQELLNLTGFEETFRTASKQAEKGEVIKFNKICRNV